MREALLGLTENPALAAQLCERLASGGEEEPLPPARGPRGTATAQVGGLLRVSEAPRR
ncbi:hypothetical protein [Streptomyces sp. NPDC053431]|uniref:hypothetical protein n=1 Tax=Streptomyces sp. NPDC053431 TaxID=3365703 RepID=UPI0037D515EB